MSEKSSRRLRGQLVEELTAAGAIRSPSVRDAFLSVPREHFVPAAAAEQGLKAVYKDDVIVTKRDARGAAISSSSQPQIMAVMLEMLQCEPGHRVLEVGAGTGYNAALLGDLVGANGRVTSVDIDRDLVRAARAHIVAAGASRPGIRLLVADGRDGAPSHAPFDRIIATASVPRVPAAWRDQLTPDGLLVAPVWLQERMNRQVVASFRRHGDALRSQSLAPGGFMALRTTSEAPTPAPALIHAGWRVDSDSFMTSVGGDIVRRMTPAARNRLAALLAETPRRARLTAPTRLTLAHLLALSPETVIEWQRHNSLLIGVASRDGRALAGVGLDGNGQPIALTVGTERALDALTLLVASAERRWARGHDIVLTATGDKALGIASEWVRS
jgi:protein-L-isoaspartate(D-aspartate) O-methyltransferase